MNGAYYWLSGYQISGHTAISTSVKPSAHISISHNQFLETWMWMLAKSYMFPFLKLFWLWGLSSSDFFLKITQVLTKESRRGSCGFLLGNSSFSQVEMFPHGEEIVKEVGIVLSSDDRTMCACADSIYSTSPSTPFVFKTHWQTHRTLRESWSERVMDSQEQACNSV